MSPLLQAPWVTSSIFRVDWLHCADQGIAADFLGALFWYMQQHKMPGNSVKERTAELWTRVQAFYTANAVTDRLQNLVPTMIRQQKKWPKLRSSAAQCRALIEFGYQLARAECDRRSPVEEALMTAMGHLRECYRALSQASIFAKDVMKDQSTKFALQFVALELFDPINFRIKPKLHLFLHVCSEGSTPASVWTYRDEDAGGTIAKFCRRRGGLLSLRAFSLNLLDRVRMQPMVRMV